MTSGRGDSSGSAALDLLKPAHCWIPPYERTNGDLAAEMGELVGLVPDAEQRLVLDAMYAEKAPGVPNVFATCLVAPRQNLKTAVYQLSTLTDAYVLDAELVVWTAHLYSTVRKAFEGLAAMVRSTPDLMAKTRDILGGRGDEVILLNSGAKIEFHCRSTRGGRGFTGNKVILDEALFLDSAAMGALLPTMATIPDAQVRLASSAGLATSQVLRSYRHRGYAGGDPTLAYIEWCAERRECQAGADCTHLLGTDGCVLDHDDLLEQANPALRRGRIQLSTLHEFRTNMPADEFMREFFGWWTDPAATLVIIPLDVWAAQAFADVPGGAPAGFGVDMTPDRQWCSIGVYSADDQIVDVVEHRYGSEWLVAAAADLYAIHRVPFAIDPRGPAANEIQTLKDAGVDVVEPKTEDVVRACADFYDELVDARRLRHASHPALDAAMEGAKWREVAGGRAYDRKHGAVISPLYAVTLAKWAASKGNDVQVFGSASLDMCDACGIRPHEDPDGEHDFLCEQCRSEEE